MFHVPDLSRDRKHPLFATETADGNNGVFHVESVEPGWRLILLCSDGLGWEHVSVQATRGEQGRIPSWKEMCQVKDLCWDPDDVVMQLHPKRSEYVNQHPHVLHLWKPIAQDIPSPPWILVGTRLPEPAPVGESIRRESIRAAPGCEPQPVSLLRRSP